MADEIEPDERQPAEHEDPEGDTAEFDDAAADDEGGEQQPEPSAAGPSTEDVDEPYVDAEQGAPGQPEPPAGRSVPPGGEGWPGRATANPENLEVLGELRVFYDGGTTVILPLDGDAALRSVTCWRHDTTVFEDPLDVTTASAEVAWLGLSLEGVLAMLWTPGLPRRAKPARMTVDPATG